jgi:hypothetical protein
MRREVGVSIVIIALLVVGGLVLFTSISRNLSDTQATVTSQADELDARATAGTEVANAATGVAQEGAAAATSAASTESALEGDIGDLEATGTQSADEQAAAEAAAASTQSALEDEASELEGQISDLEATGTQGAEDVSATEAAVDATQSSLGDAINELEATATQAADVRAELQASAAAVQEDFATSQSQITILEADATQAAVERAEIVMAAATAQAASAATLTALQSQSANPPTQVVQNPPTLVPLSTPTTVVSNVRPIASVQVGNLNVQEEFNATSSWFVGPVTGAGNAALANGQYVITVDVVPQSLQSFAQPIIADGYAEVEAYLSDCTRGGFVGMLMRVQDFGTGGYLFAFACDLSFWAIVTFPTNGQPEVLSSNNLSGVSPTSPHTIGVMLDGNFLAMYLNGQLLGSATDNTFSQGMLGLYAESGNAEVVLRFDNFRVWNLQ